MGLLGCVGLAGQVALVERGEVEVVGPVEAGGGVGVDRHANRPVAGRGGRERGPDLGDGVLRVVEEGADADQQVALALVVLLPAGPVPEPGLLLGAGVAVVVHRDAEVEIAFPEPGRPVLVDLGVGPRMLPVGLALRPAAVGDQGAA